MRSVLLIIFLAWCSAAGAQTIIIDSGSFNKPPQMGDYITIWGVHIYDLDGHAVREKNIDSISNFIDRHPRLVFRIESHTDCRASNEFNLEYSQRLADSLRARLLMQLKNGDQLPEALGRGEEDLLVEKCKCDRLDEEYVCTEAEHSKNRRFVLRVIDIRKEE